MEPAAAQKKAFGEAMRRARQAAGLSVPQLADLLGTSHQKLYQWEAGQGAPESREDLDGLEDQLRTEGRLALVLLGTELAGRVAAIEERANATEQLIDEILRRLEAE